MSRPVRWGCGMPEPAIFKEIKPLVDIGFALHWLKPRQKRPYAHDWSTLPVASMDDLRESYRKGNNVGVRLGRYSKVCDLFLHVLDIDIRAADEEEEAIQALEELFPGYDLDEFPLVKSGSGGPSRHYYILVDRAFASKKLRTSGRKYTDANGRKHWTWEIELFGTGKQVAMPPSIHPDSGLPYEWVREFEQEALAADDDNALLALAHSSLPLGLTEDSAWEILSALPMDEFCEDRDGWLKVGMALHHEFSGADEGYELWCKFSQQSDRFDPEDQERVWKSFRSDRSETVTMGFFRKYVHESGLEYTQCQAILMEDGLKYRSAIPRIAKFELLSSEQDAILKILRDMASQEGISASVSSIRRDLTTARQKYLKEEKGQDTQNSIEIWLATETLRVFFAEGDHLIYHAGTPWVYRRGVWGMTDKEFINNRVWKLTSRVLGSGKGVPEALKELARSSDRVEFVNALTNAVYGVLAKMQAMDSSTDPLRLTSRFNDSVMNCVNGELWFENGEFELREHDPSNRFTNRLGAMYDPDAKCPRWDKALKRIFRDTKDPEGMIRHLHEVMGYLVQSSRDIAAWVMFHGLGANGKSFVASVLQHIMGQDSCVGQEIRSLERDKHATASLVGKLLLIDDDFQKGAPLPDGMIKKLSESKALTANPKFGQPFGFVCRATPMILTNHWPQTSDLSHGMTRRALVFDFNTRITEEEMDHGLLSYVTEHEASGVLNHLIAGWCRVQARGGFDQPIDCIRAKGRWSQMRNAIAMFLSESVQVTGNQKDRVIGTDLWESFRYWAMENNYDNRMSRSRFYSEVEQLNGVVMGTTHGVKVFRGLVLGAAQEGFDAESDDLLDELV